MLNFIKSLFKAPKISSTGEKLLNIYIEAGVLKIYDIIPEWLLCGNYEDMKKGRGLLGKYLISNLKQIKKLGTQTHFVQDIGSTMGYTGAYDYITEVISKSEYEKLKKILQKQKTLKNYVKR